MLSVQALQRSGLHPVSFELATHQCFAVFGPSGAGKSLLLRAIADLDENTGTVMLDGEIRETMPAPQWRRQVIYVPAEPGWWADTVKPHFSHWQTAIPLVERLGLPAACADWSILRLSTGERQRLGLIRAFVQSPKVLLLDEPTSGLDSETVAHVEQLIKMQLEQGTHVLWVTHNMTQAKRVASRGLEIKQGFVREVQL